MAAALAPTPATVSDRGHRPRLRTNPRADRSDRRRWQRRRRTGSLRRTRRPPGEPGSGRPAPSTPPKHRRSSTGFWITVFVVAAVSWGGAVAVALTGWRLWWNHDLGELNAFGHRSHTSSQTITSSAAGVQSERDLDEHPPLASTSSPPTFLLDVVIDADDLKVRRPRRPQPRAPAPARQRARRGRARSRRNPAWSGEKRRETERPNLS